MRESYLEITFRHGRSMAAYYYLPRRPGQRAHRTVQAAPGVMVDYGRGGRPIGVEITAPGKVTLSVMNEVLAGLGLKEMPESDFAPLLAA